MVIEFQSLVGFKINWNELPLLRMYWSAVQVFQSLVGFKINWNGSGKWRETDSKVSIPSRV